MPTLSSFNFSLGIGSLVPMIKLTKLLYFLVYLTAVQMLRSYELFMGKLAKYFLDGHNDAREISLT